MMQGTSVRGQGSAEKSNPSVQMAHLIWKTWATSENKGPDERAKSGDFSLLPRSCNLPISEYDLANQGSFILVTGI